MLVLRDNTLPFGNLTDAKSQALFDHLFKFVHRPARYGISCFYKIKTIKCLVKFYLFKNLFAEKKLKHQIPMIKRTIMKDETSLEYPASSHKIEGSQKHSVEIAKLTEPVPKTNCSIQYPCTKKDVSKEDNGIHFDT
jgi:hypothetical protein